MQHAAVGDDNTTKDKNDERLVQWSRDVANSVAVHGAPDGRTMIQNMNCHDSLPSDDASREHDHLTVEVKSKGSALEPIAYAFMHKPGGSEAYLHYSRKIEDQELLYTVLTRRLAIERRLLDRENKISRRAEHTRSRKKARFVLNETEKSHIRDTILTHRDTKFGAGSTQLADLVEPLGGHGLEEYQRVVAKYIDNNRKRIWQCHESNEGLDIADLVLQADDL